MRKEPMHNRQVLQEFQERMLKGIQAIEKDHVIARGYEQYNEGWDHALERVRALLRGVVKDLAEVSMAETVNATVEELVFDPINRPAYYLDGGIETLDYILAKKMDFLTGQICKYISRYGKKDPTKKLEDLKKAQFYLNRKIAEVEKSEAQQAKMQEERT